MSRLSQIVSAEEYATKDASRLPPFDSRLLIRHAPDAHWIVTGSADQVTARISLWWTHVPPLTGHRLGVLGHFAALDKASAQAALIHAIHELARRGCTLAVGPMDGNTWRHYRLLTERGVEPPFFLEPDNPDEWPLWFGDCGFSALATYFSSLAEDLALEDPRIPKAAERLKGNGVCWRNLNSVQFSEELGRIYKVSAIGFKNNFLYTPITEAEFLSQYQAVRDHVQSELVLIAEQAGMPVGFVFAIPDLLQVTRRSIDTVIVKTVAVLPGRDYAGLGNVLVACCHEAARNRGFRRAIHALMHQTNNSLNLSAHYARPFRRYTLFARSLE